MSGLHCVCFCGSGFWFNRTKHPGNGLKGVFSCYLNLYSEQNYFLGMFLYSVLASVERLMLSLGEVFELVTRNQCLPC